MDLVYALREIVGKEYVLDKYEEILPYSRDASIFEGKLPRAVVLPRTSQEISKILRFATENKIPVTVRGGGSSLVGGSVLLEDGIIISMARFDRILEINIENRYVVAEAGVKLDFLNDNLKKYNHFYPPDPASSITATVGGSINTNAGGLRTVMYGATKEWVLGMEVVLPTGEIIQLGGKVLKRALGYDLTSLFIGSEGTLGIITEAILKIAPLPESTGRILSYYEDIENAGRAVSLLKRKGYTPYIAEFMDRIAMDSITKVRGIKFPEKARYLILVDVASTKESLKRMMDEFENVIKETSPLTIKKTIDPVEMDEMYQARKGLYSSQLLERKSPEEYIIIGDVIVPASELPSALKEMDEKIRSSGFRATLFGHIGDGNIHANIFVNPKDRTMMENVFRLLFDLGLIALKHGGSVSSEHGIGLEKKDLIMEEMKFKNSMKNIEIMKNVKGILDPADIMNRGKLI